MVSETLQRFTGLSGLIITLSFILSCGTTAQIEEQSGQETVQEEQKAAEEVQPVPVEIQSEAVKNMFWNDAVPFGQIGETAIEVPIEENKGYIIPELGAVLSGDKAGPEFFIFMNQGVFNGEGHIRGVQYDWWEDETSKIHMTLDLTGSEVIVKNADYGEESGYGFAGRTIWPGDVVYQVFFPFNGDREMTYMEYEYQGQYYFMGEYRE